MDSKVLYIWLSKIKGIGPVLASKIIEYFGRIDFVYKATYDELIKINGIGPKVSKVIVENKSLDESKRIYEKCKRLNIEVITKESSNYPMQLRSNIKAPLVLYVRGNLKNFDNAISIVGSRRCTEYGKNITIELATALSEENIPIVSGMAKGIYSYAHTVALHNNNYTIAILGTGVDKCYPSEHLSLMNKIIEDGVIISQFEPGTSNIRSNFIKRNELIAMLAEKIIIVQATKNSGAIYTAHCGIEYKKEVYSVPGNINSKYSEGTNMLISEGVKPYLSIRTIINEELKVCSNKGYINEKLNSIEKQILKLISKNKMSVDQLKIKLKLENYNLEELLFDMEVKGQIKQVAGYIKPGNF